MGSSAVGIFIPDLRPVIDFEQIHSIRLRLNV